MTTTSARRSTSRRACAAQGGGGEILLSQLTADLTAKHLPAGYSLVDLGPHRLRGVEGPQTLHAVAGPGVTAPAPATQCPYRGLLAFDADDRAFFFGREAVLGSVIERLAPRRLLALVGASGSGKSSLLRAGLIASVGAGEVPGVTSTRLVHPGAQPPAAIDGDAATLVVVDQFEELYTLCDDPAERGRFIDALLAHPGPVAIGVRADFYGELSAHPELASAVASNQILLGAMSEEELRRAVTEPARLAGLRLEPGLVDVVLGEVAGEPGALPLLSHALRATWERRDGRTLTVDAYRASGGVTSAVAQSADALVEAVPAGERHLLRNVFLRLTELGDGVEDTRRRVPIDELVPQDVPGDAVRGLLGRFADARLVTLGEGTAEVAHEVLIREWPTLRGWLEEDREGLRLHRRLGDAARIWEAAGRDPTDLYRGTRLGAALEWAQGHHDALNAAERAFLDASVAESERERRAQIRANRRLRALLAGAGVLLVAATVAGLLALRESDNARDSAADRRRPAARRSGADRRPARPEPPARPGRPRARRHRGHPQPSPVGARPPSRRARRDAGRRGPALRAGTEPRRADARHRRRERDPLALRPAVAPEDRPSDPDGRPHPDPRLLAGRQAAGRQRRSAGDVRS